MRDAREAAESPETLAFVIESRMTFDGMTTSELANFIREDRRRAQLSVLAELAEARELRDHYKAKSQEYYDDASRLWAELGKVRECLRSAELDAMRARERAEKAVADNADLMRTIAQNQGVYREEKANLEALLAGQNKRASWAEQQRREMRAKLDAVRGLVEKLCVDLETQGYTDWPSEVRVALESAIAVTPSEGEPSSNEDTPRKGP